MSGYLIIIGLVSLQMMCVMSVNEYTDKKLQNNVWLGDVDDRQPGSRIERNDQFETFSEVAQKDASTYPKIARRGYAGEEFFLKASKSVPRIGRRNNDNKESPKRSTTDQISMTDYLPYIQSNDINDLSLKRDFDSTYGCQQLDAKTIVLADMYNLVCNDQLYCCTQGKRDLKMIVNPTNMNYL